MALWHHFYIYINIGITNYNNVTKVLQLTINYFNIPRRYKNVEFLDRSQDN